MSRTMIAAMAMAATALLPVTGNAKGCLKGAAVGGVAGHVAGHHAVAGAAVGCVVQHHREKVKDKAAAQQANRPNVPPPAAPGTPPPSQ